MKYALAVNEVCESLDDNVAKILEQIETASKNGADMIIFPEAAITGLYNKDLPEFDYGLCLSEDSAILAGISQKAKDLCLYVSIGFLEKENDYIFDSVICFDPSGSIISKYRRNSSGWHGKEANPEIYKEGKEIVEFTIDGRRCSYLICGDLFDESLVNKIKDRDINVLIIPLARSFKETQNAQNEWEENELIFYAEQCYKTKALCFMVNYIDTNVNGGYYFGGAHVIKEGKVVDKLPIGSPGILYYDIT